MTTTEAYKIKFDPKVYLPDQQQPNKIPDNLREALESVDGLRLRVYSSRRNFVGVSISPDKLEELNALEGILSVSPDKQYDLDN